jgi:hypothetical protein
MYSLYSSTALRTLLIWSSTVAIFVAVKVMELKDVEYNSKDG